MCGGAFFYGIFREGGPEREPQGEHDDKQKLDF